MKVGVKDLNRYIEILNNLGNHFSDYDPTPVTCNTRGRWDTPKRINVTAPEMVEAIETASNIMQSLTDQLENQEYDF